jgi:hypothetical protein
VVGNLGTSPDLLVTVRSLLFTDLSACLAQWPTDKLLAQAVVVLVGILSASMFEVRLGSMARRFMLPPSLSLASSCMLPLLACSQRVYVCLALASPTLYTPWWAGWAVFRLLLFELGSFNR